MVVKLINARFKDIYEQILETFKILCLFFYEWVKYFTHKGV